MKSTLKNVLTISVILFSLFFFSCSEEIYQSPEHSHENDENKISLSQFKRETNIKDFKTLFNAPITTNGDLSRTAELSQFVIDTVAIQRYVGENDKTTYSFRIYTLVSYEQPDEKYNLVYTKENGVWEKSIIAFKERVGATSIENQFEDFEKLYDSRTTNATSVSPSEVCISESYAFHCTNSGSCADTGHCDMCYLCVTRTVTVEFCSSGGGTPSDPNGNDPLYSGPGIYDPSNPFTFTPNMYENQVFDDPNYINAVKAQYFFEQLDYTQQLWATQTQENTATYNQFIQYLIQNNWSEASTVLMSKLIVISVEHGGRFTLDDTINEDNAMVFDSSNQFQVSLNNQSDEGADFEYVEQQNEKIASTKFWIGAPFNGVKVNVKQNMTPPYAVENVTSEMFGVTVFADWDQSDYGVSITNNIVTVDVYGVASVKVFFEGIGTIYHENQHFQIKINKSTGTIISAVVIH